ncbi:heme-dependent oxidative N-demethylase family protein [Mameliella sp.]|uniref:heme-dependent oxidative N-demethylase family protein n=1 Tax=Mameliella sp. TaxID=1924940 RepID=UPI003BA9FA13
MILQDRIPYDVTAPRPLPGIAPLDPADWLIVDEAYAAQMAERRRLLTDRRDEVLALSAAAVPAAEELMETVLAALPDLFSRGDNSVLCPDGTRFALDGEDPLGTLGQIVQEDLCLMEKHGDQHVLTGAVLCFPASWRLDEKFMRPMTAIHAPVDSFDDNIARRVQRLFDGVQAGRPLWRFNALRYAESELFHPRSMHTPRAPVEPATAPFWRSERQCILRLPKTRAVVFSIHTYLVRSEEVTAATAGGNSPSGRSC